MCRFFELKHGETAAAWKSAEMAVPESLDIAYDWRYPGALPKRSSKASIKDVLDIKFALAHIAIRQRVHTHHLVPERIHATSYIQAEELTFVEHGGVRASSQSLSQWKGK
jgi:hypothetical protein